MRLLYETPPKSGLFRPEFGVFSRVAGRSGSLCLPQPLAAAEGARRAPSVCASRGIGAASSLGEGAKGRGKNVRGGIDKSPALPYNNSEERTTHTVSSS